MKCSTTYKSKSPLSRSFILSTTKEELVVLANKGFSLVGEIDVEQSNDSFYPYIYDITFTVTSNETND